MPPADVPLSRERILAAATDMIRRHGPTKATVVDVARELGVSHTAVYRHFATKAELRDLVVQTWVETTMPELRSIATSRPSAPARLKKFYTSLMEIKRRRAAEDPELFAAYRTLCIEATSVAEAHVAELIELTAAIIRVGVEEGSFRAVEPMTAARAVLYATSRFHHPAHFAEWVDPRIDATFDEVWRMLMDGLVTKEKRR